MKGLISDKVYYVNLPIIESDLHGMVSGVYRQQPKFGSRFSQGGYGTSNKRHGEHSSGLLSPEEVRERAVREHWGDGDRVKITFDEYSSLEYPEKLQLLRLISIWHGVRLLYSMHYSFSYQDEFQDRNDLPVDFNFLDAYPQFALVKSLNKENKHRINTEMQMLFAAQIVNFYYDEWSTQDGDLSQDVLSLFKKELGIPEKRSLEAYSEIAKHLPRNKDFALSAKFLQACESNEITHHSLLLLLEALKKIDAQIHIIQEKIENRDTASQEIPLLEQLQQAVIAHKEELYENIVTAAVSAMEKDEALDVEQLGAYHQLGRLNTLMEEIHADSGKEQKFVAVEAFKSKSTEQTPTWKTALKVTAAALCVIAGAALIAVSCGVATPAVVGAGVAVQAAVAAGGGSCVGGGLVGGWFSLFHKSKEKKSVGKVCDAARRLLHTMNFNQAILFPLYFFFTDNELNLSISQALLLMAS